MMGTEAGMLTAARASIGMSGRPNTITRAYAEDHGDEFLRAAWCNMAVTYWARKSGNAGAVLLGGDRAYTVSHAMDFKNAGRWFEGSAANVNRAKPGDIVFFDWGNSNSIGAIDHVGVVEVVLGGGRVQTIEGNTGNACKRRVRSSLEIAGFGRPPYGADKPYKWDGRAPSATLRAGATGVKVRDLQNALLRAGFKLPVFGADEDFGDETAAAVRALQRGAGLQVTGVYDAATAAALARALGPVEEDALKTIVDLGTHKAETVRAGERRSLDFELTWADPDGVHTDAKDGKGYPSVFPKGADAAYAVCVEVHLAGAPEAGVELYVSAYERNADKLVRDIRGMALARQHDTMTGLVRMSDKEKYRADVINNSGQDVVVERAFMLIAR
jgi:hypothetical protein